MEDNSNLLAILKILQERDYSRNTHQQILKIMGLAKREGKDLMPQVLQILMRTADEKEVLKNVMDLEKSSTKTT